MRVLPPVNLYGTAAVTSSTIAEPDTTLAVPEQVWSNATTYALNAQVIETTNHRKYQSLQAGNLNHALPNFALGETSNSWWVDIGPTNKWAMFDLMRNTQSQGNSSLVVVLTPGVRVDSIALLGLYGQTVRIVGTSSGNTVYDSGLITIRSRNINDWYDYFFDPFYAVPSLFRTNIPPYTNIVLTITINDPGGAAKCGGCVIGTSTFIGDIEFNPVSDAVNFSTVSRDNFGNATLTARRSVPKTTQKVFAASTLINTIRDLRTLLNAAVAVWIGLEDLTADYGETMLIIGFYRTWTIDLTAPSVVEQTLEIEEI